MLAFLTEVGQGGRVRPALRRDAHVGADRRDVAQRRRAGRRPATSRARCTRATRRGARRRSRSTRTTRGWATPRCCSCAARVTSTDGTPLPDAVIDIWQTGRAAATTSGTSASPTTTSAAASASPRRRVRVPDDGPEALHRPDRRARRPLPGGGRPASVAARRTSTSRSTAAGHEPLVTQVFFPGDPYLENDTIGAVKAALVRPLERHDGRRGLAPFSTCDFDIGCLRRRGGVDAASRAASLGGRRFAALVEDDVVRPLRDVAELGARHAVGGARGPAADRRARSRSPTCAAARRAAPGQGRLRRAELPRARRRGRLRRAGLPGAVPEVRRDAGRRRATRSCCRRSPRRSTTRPSSRSWSAAACGAATGATALAAVAGYTVANDVTMRDYQYRTHQWLPGKNWAGSTPLGPVPRHPGRGRRPARARHLARAQRRADAVRQHEPVHLRHPDVIGDHLRVRAARAGRRRAHRTPSGVGYRRDPKVLLRDGDRVVVEIERVGRLENPVAAE